MAYIPYRTHPLLMLEQLKSSGRLDAVLGLPDYSAFSKELLLPILEEAHRFASETLSPLNHTGDREGSTLKDGNVSTPAGFKAAYKAFCDNGWNAAGAAPDMGGQGLPVVLTSLISEMWHGSNMAFGLCPMLSQSAGDLIERFATPALKDAYLPHLISGHWTGTMCITEPQAGSDVGAILTRAERAEDGYRMYGTKIYITYGDHDLSENIIHLVLARIQGAPSGYKGLSLFLVPKFLLDKDGNPAQRNDVSCVSLEHKLGIHASPTCVMQFGEKVGATGYLVGEENKGLQAMFAMMNAARFAVGLEGVGVAGYAYHMASSYAVDRVQGAPVQPAGGQTISSHPDVERMVHRLRAHALGLRALTLYTASFMDEAKHAVSQEAQALAQERVSLLIPVVKSHCTQTAFDMSSLAIQVFGGMGYIEETGVAQLMRDVRVAAIYEGTNGIQAQDLAQRKLPLREGKAMQALLSDWWHHIQQWRDVSTQATRMLLDALEGAFAELDKATIWMRQTLSDSYSEPAAMRALLAASDGYVELLGVWLEAYLLTKNVMDIEHGSGSVPDDSAKEIRTAAEFFCTYELSRVYGLSHRIVRTRFWSK